jgi:hypothetical protein
MIVQLTALLAGRTDTTATGAQDNENRAAIKWFYGSTQQIPVFSQAGMGRSLHGR